MSTPKESPAEKTNIAIPNVLTMPLTEPVVVEKPKKEQAETIPSATNGIQVESWLTAQNPDHYTLQLLGSRNEKQLAQLIKTDTTTKDMAYFKSTRDNEPWYSLVYGAFPTLEEAKAAFEDIPASLRNNNPWIRTFSEIHNIMEQAPEPSGNIFK